jgi:hypothetical protein
MGNAIVALWKRIVSSFGHGPGSIPIRNPWTEGFTSAQLEVIRKSCQVVIGLMLEEAPDALRNVPRKWRKTFEELVFTAACRACALDGQKEFSWELVKEHLEAVLKEFTAQALGTPPAG